MQKEKREMIARNLEENKEKIELSQKLLSMEKEVNTLKSKLTKLTLIHKPSY
jgi:5-bromo-4-chloroindolyl phosphate hydrolysis protein